MAGAEAGRGAGKATVGRGTNGELKMGKGSATLPITGCGKVIVGGGATGAGNVGAIVVDVIAVVLDEEAELN